MPYSNFQKTWKVTEVFPAVLTTNDMAKASPPDLLTFVGSGGGADSDVLRRKHVISSQPLVTIETDWAMNCRYRESGGKQQVTVTHLWLDIFTIEFIPGTPAKLVCKIGDVPTGTAWTAEEGP